MRHSFLRANLPLFAVAAAAMTIVVVRACVQSITIDEADSYLIFARESWPGQWYPSSGNHVLNTILMRLLTTIFGFNQLTVRMPAILGAAVYIGAAVYLCRLLTEGRFVRVVLFACLVFNPIILDYLVAARGYSLSIGFLAAALALLANAVINGKLGGQAFWISILLALSFAANFSFAIADATVLIFVFVWAWRGAMTPRAALSLLLPGLFTAFVLAGSVVLSFPKDQLYFGSHSLREMWHGLRYSSFDELNPEVLNPMLLKWFAKTRNVLPQMWVVAFGGLLIWVEIRRFLSRSAPVDPLLTLTRLLAGITLVTLAVHWTAFHTIGLLLPKDRTALFFVLFLTLTSAALVALLYRSPGQWAARMISTGVLAVVAIYFAGCLRLGYFKEWKFNADTKYVYWLVSDLRQRCDITDFFTDWRYTSTLNFYRGSYDNYSLPEFQTLNVEAPPPGRAAYVLFYPTSDSFIRRERLRVVYHGGDSQVALAVRACASGTGR